MFWRALIRAYEVCSLLLESMHDGMQCYHSRGVLRAVYSGFVEQSLVTMVISGSRVSGYGLAHTG